MPPVTQHPLAVVRRARDEFGVRRVMVGCSCGKDATASLILAKDHFPEVLAYFMHYIPGLSFQEKYLAYLERTFSISIIRVPHWRLSHIIKAGQWRIPTRSEQTLGRKIKIADVEHYLRQQHNVEWFVTGEKCVDSLERNAMIKQAAAISEKRRRIWPLAYWTHAAVFNFLKSRQVALPPDYSTKKVSSMGSFSPFNPHDLLWCRDRFPDDYRKIIAMFPLLPGMLTRHEQQQKLAEKKADG